MTQKKKCFSCLHCEMCKWIDEVHHDGCDFFAESAEPCEDAVSRKELQIVLLDEGLDQVQGISGRELCQIVEALSTVQPEGKVGHWIDITNKNGTVIAVRCSHCEKSPKHAIKSDFCPNCSTKMVEPQESEK